MAVYVNPLFVPMQSPNDKSTDEWLSALKGEEECLQIFFGKGIPHTRPSEKIADEWLTYVDGTGEIREKIVSFDERVISCGDHDMLTMFSIDRIAR